MIFSGTVSKYSTVTVGGNPASLDASNNFRGMASVSSGTNNVPIIAQDVDGNVSTNTYQVVVPPGSGSSYTYDLNGNLIGDGTNTYSWDAKNELVKITYPSGATSNFVYNGAGARVEIIEKNSSGTVTSTKQYVAGEERDGSNLITKRYFAQGEQRISGSTATNYFYTFDHLGSVREMIASDGTTIAARYSYDPYGRATKVSGSLDCDFQFTGYYYHAASGLLLSATRAYNPNLGRFISRDPSGEGSGLNLYAYCGDNPICATDSSGLCIDTPFNPDTNFDDQDYYTPPDYAIPGPGPEADYCVAFAFYMAIMNAGGDPGSWNSFVMNLVDQHNLEFPAQPITSSGPFSPHDIQKMMTSSTTSFGTDPTPDPEKIAKALQMHYGVVLGEVVTQNGKDFAHRVSVISVNADGTYTVTDSYHAAPHNVPICLSR